MRFAIISPAAGLQEFASLSKTHLVLAQVDNLAYWKYYEKQSQAPEQMIILDNGAYEGKLNMDTALMRLQQLRVTCLVLPDVKGGSAAHNFDLARDFLKTWRHQLSCDFMYVPQFDGTHLDYQLMKRNLEYMIKDYGISWFGVPRIIAERGYSRAMLVRIIKDIQFNDGFNEAYVHALGMNAGSLTELTELEEAGCDSIDSSAPVWRGWNGYSLEHGDAWKRSGSPCNFNVHPNTLTDDKRLIIRENLRKVGVPC